MSFRLIQPAPQPVVQSLDKAKKAEKARNNQACNECRRSRTRCDGGRPNCATCMSRNRSCTYVGSRGETRIEATKNRLELLEKVISTLQTASPEQAAELVDGIRSSRDLTMLLNQVVVSPRPRAPPSHSFDASSIPGGLTSATESEPTPASSSNSSPPQRQASLDAQKPATITPPEPSQRSEPLISAGNRKISVVALSGAYTINLPDAKDVARAVSGFYRCSGALFHVFTEAQMKELYEAVYGHTENQMSPPVSKICCLMSIAAVGAQYEHGSYDLKTEASFYDIAKHYLDSIVQDDCLNATKVCVLLSIYNVMHKATVALAYVEVGLSLVRQFQIATEDRKYPGPHGAAFAEFKHTWRTLTFLSSWLSSTLGYVSGNDLGPHELPPNREFPTGDEDIIEIVQAEMTNVAVLKSKILRMHLAFKDLTIRSVDSILLDLQTYYGRMPPQIRLDYEGRESFTSLTKWSIYHVHLLYLGANILLYRRMSSQLMETQCSKTDRGVLYSPLEKIYSDHGQQAVLAAKGSARILTLLLEDCGIFKRCWLVIFQAYTSGLIILHSAIQKVLHNWQTATWQDDLDKARLCLQVLEYCAASDSAAERFLCELRVTYDYILNQGHVFTVTSTTSPSSAQSDGRWAPDRFASIGDQADVQGPEHDSSYLIRMPSDANPAHLEHSYRLLVKLCQPFGDPKRQNPGIDDLKQRWRDEPTRGLHTLMMARLDWDLESRQSISWNAKSLFEKDDDHNQVPQKPTFEANTRQPVSVVIDGFKGRFLGSTRPSGWESWTGVDLAPISSKHVQVTVDEMMVDS